MTEDERIAQLFSFLSERGFTFERDYSKGTDTTCTQIYRFRLDGANYFEYRVLSARERTLLVCVRGEKKFPAEAVKPSKSDGKNISHCSTPEYSVTVGVKE